MKELGTGIYSVGGNQGAAVFFNKVKEPDRKSTRLNSSHT